MCHRLIGREAPPKGVEVDELLEVCPESGMDCGCGWLQYHACSAKQRPHQMYMARTSLSLCRCSGRTSFHSKPIYPQGAVWTIT
jgi:hypothetical protein